MEGMLIMMSQGCDGQVDEEVDNFWNWSRKGSYREGDGMARWSSFTRMTPI